MGISIAANKVNGIRACCCSDVFSAKYTRMHNDANALCMGGRVVGPGLAVELVDAFLAAGFEGGRHARRVEKLAAIEAREARRPYGRLSAVFRALRGQSLLFCEGHRRFSICLTKFFKGEIR